MVNVGVSKPKEFLNIGDVGELDGRYYRLDGINNMRNGACFTEIEIHKMKGNIDGFVELDE